MDKETVANYISSLGKRDFEITCRIVLDKIFNLNAINVDGAYDGGSDFVSFCEDGKRENVAYQITTQKTEIKNKAYKDARKSLDKLGAKKYYFMCTYKVSEEEARKLENEIENTLDVRAYVYYPSVIAGLLIGNDLVKDFLDETGFPDLRASSKSSVDYRQRVLHSYTLLSSDAKNLKEQIYDDSIMLAMSEHPEGLSKEDIISNTIDILRISSTKGDRLSGRIDSLLSKLKIYKGDNSLYFLSKEVAEEISYRQTLYERELELLSAAQSDILQEIQIGWTIEDARTAACWIANICLSKQISALEKVDAPLAKDFGKAFDNGGIKELKRYLTKSKGVPPAKVDDIIEKFLSIASVQPLIKKISRACVYVALEGKNPITSCRALGVSRWCDFNMIIEPTIAIPLLCSYMFDGHVNRTYDNAIKSAQLAEELGIPQFIPQQYIKECAGHLHMARKYNDIALDPNEMVFSNNAFVSYYYSLKLRGVELPGTYMDYLATFSPSIKIEKEYRAWIRSLMTDLQSHFTRTGGLNYMDFPRYDSEDLKEIEDQYSIYLETHYIEKPHKLLMNDVTALKYIDEKTSQGENWMMITYDNSLVGVSKQCRNNGWVTTPYDFIEMVDISRPLSETELTSLVHSVAHFSESTLSVGARIIDKIILYASDKMQNFEFQQELTKFKAEIQNVSPKSKNYLSEIDRRTDEFLAKHGVELSCAEDTDADVDIENVK